MKLWRNLLIDASVTHNAIYFLFLRAGGADGAIARGEAPRRGA
jgi:hypothetical protein